MDTADEVRAHLSRLHEAVWELAAIALSLRDPATSDPDQRQAAQRVLVEASLMISTSDGAQPSPGLAQVIRGDATSVASQAATGILQSASFLSGADAWSRQDDEAILAQGRASAQGAEPFKIFALPMMQGLDALLSGPSPVMLDVGVGVAALAVAYCQIFPNLRIVGIDVFSQALKLAHATVGDAEMADRIELRQQDVAHLEDRETFCLGWLPAPFVPRAALDAGLPRMVAALVPGGWIMVGHGRFGESGVTSAVTRFQTIAFGGTAINGNEAQEILRDVGLELIATLPTPEGAPGITVGRRPVNG